MTPDRQGPSPDAQPLAYDVVPVRAHVERFDGGARLIVPNQHVFARLLVVEAGAFVFPVLCLIGAVAAVVVPRLLNLNASGRAAAQLPAALALLIGVATAGVQLLALALQARQTPPATVLVWDGDQLVIESLGFATRNSGGGGSAWAAGDVQRWSRAALAYVEAEAINAVVPTSLSRIRIQSRFDFPFKIACHPSRDLAPAVAEFQALIKQSTP